MINCVFCEVKQCESDYTDCQRCRVPNSFGVFFVLKGTKMVQEQRFILEAYRVSRITKLKAQIKQLQDEILEVSLIPSADEYRESKAGDAMDKRS